MARYTIKRILWIIPILIGVITIVFFISAVTPGNPAASLLGPTATPEQITAMEHTLGLDQPLLKRWLDYIIDVVTRLDFGDSFVTRQPVRDEILAFFPVTPDRPRETPVYHYDGVAAYPIGQPPIPGVDD